VILYYLAKWGVLLVPEGDRSEGQIAQDLVAYIKAGNQTAEGQLIERYSKGLLIMLRQRTRDSQLADDLHQETFLIVLAKIKDGKIEDPTKLAGYIHRVAINLTIADYRKRFRRTQGFTEAEPDHIETPATSQFLQVCRQDEAQLVRQTIAELKNERDRQILFRFYVAEQDKAEVMAALNLDKLHFNRVLFRARKRFEELWMKRAEVKTHVMLVFLMIFFGIAHGHKS
jgi:RNA polymerase sigma-70 factor (ECF subfamily)